MSGFGGIRLDGGVVWVGAWLMTHCLLLSVGARAEDPVAVSAAPVVVTTRVDPAHVTVGTPFRYTMRIEAAGDTELIVPVLGGRLGEFLIADFGDVPQRTEKGRMVTERWYTLVAYEAGDHIVPGPTVQYRTPGTELQRLDPPDALIIVDSLLPKGGEAHDIRDPKTPVEVPRDYRPLWWALAALATVAGAGFGVYRLLNRRRLARITPPRPAHQVALEALARLRGARLLEAGQPKEYYVRLTDIVRTYLEGRFELRAPEMTTEEFLQAAQRNPQLAAAHRSLLAQFLSQSDLVKFARHVPSLGDAEGAYASAREFIESTKLEEERPRAAA